MHLSRALLMGTLAALPGIALMLPAVASETTPVGPWAQFRGASVDGVSPETGIFSGFEAFGLTAGWKKSLGSGYAGVAVSGWVAVTGFSDGRSDVVVALDAESGKERWRYPFDETYEGHDGSHTGPIATPLIAGNHVIVLAPRGRFFSVSLESGEVQWSHDLAKDHGAVKPHYGFATSPILVDGRVILQLGAPGGALAAFAPSTGEMLWKTGSDTIGYQTPVPMTRNGAVQVLAAGMQRLFAHDVKTGEILWKYAHRGVGGKGAGSMVPVPVGQDRIFLTHRDDASTMIRLLDEEGETVVKPLWEDRAIRNTYVTPVHHEGHVYAYSSRFLICVDAETGEARWRSRQPGDGFPILVDGHLLIATKQGGVHVAEATPEGYREVTALPLFEELIWSPPTFSGGHLFVRGLGGIARVDVVPGASSAESVVAAGNETASDSRFARFLAGVARSSDKKPLVDRFMDETDSFPLVEGKNRVHFIYRGEGEDLAIAGDMLGARQETPMTRVEGTDLFYYSTTLEPDARVNYLFLRDYEETTDPRNPRGTVSIMLGKDMEMSFSGAELPMSWVAMPEWKEPTHLEEPDPERRGKMETRELESKALNTRHTVDVYLPAGYEEGDGRYPVIYVHGGPAALKYGKYEITLDNLSGRRVAPVVAVFIRAATGFGPPDPYVEMVNEELIPFIDENFRTVAEPGARANVGSGFAGFAAVQCTLAPNSRVHRLATQSAFLMDSMMGAIETMIPEAKDSSVQLYVDWAKYDLRNPHEAWDVGEGNEKFAAMLRKKGHKVHGGEANDGCGWSSWRNRTAQMLETLFPVASGGEGD